MEPSCSRLHLLPSSLRVRTTTKRQPPLHSILPNRLTSSSPPSPKGREQGPGWLFNTGMHMLRLLPHPRDKHQCTIQQGLPLASPYSLGSSWRAHKLFTFLQGPSTCPRASAEHISLPSGIWIVPGSGRRHRDKYISEVLSPVPHPQRPRPTPHQKPPPGSMLEF